MMIRKSIISEIISKRNAFSAVTWDDGEILENAGAPFFIRHPRGKKLTPSDVYAEVMVETES